MIATPPVLTFNELLDRHGIDPARTVVFRHRPTEPELNRNFDMIVSERPDLFDCYQNTHNERTEAALKRATHVASFIRRQAGKALFVGVYRIAGWRDLTSSEWESRAAQIELVKLGMAGASGGAWRESISEFDLVETEVLGPWRNRLVIAWPPPERSWYRWADRNVFPVLAIAEDDALRPPICRIGTISVFRRRGWQYFRRVGSRPCGIGEGSILLRTNLIGAPMLVRPAGLRTFCNAGRSMGGPATGVTNIFGLVTRRTLCSRFFSAPRRTFHWMS